VEGVSPGAVYRVTGPGGQEADLSGDAAGNVRFAGTSRVGVYRLAAEGDKDVAYAVNLLNAAESDVLPAEAIVTNGLTVPAESGQAVGNRELWPWLAVGALALICLEWLVYNRKMRL
jgi:hypothetical protein